MPTALLLHRMDGWMNNRVYYFWIFYVCRYVCLSCWWFFSNLKTFLLLVLDIHVWKMKERVQLTMHIEKPSQQNNFKLKKDEWIESCVQEGTLKLTERVLHLKLGIRMQEDVHLKHACNRLKKHVEASIKKKFKACSKIIWFFLGFSMEFVL